MSTRRTPTTLWQPIRPYESAERTLAAFDALLTRAADAGVTPSPAVTQCRADLHAIALEEAQTAAEIDGVSEAQSMATSEALAILARDRKDTTPAERTEALTRAIGSDTPENVTARRRMHNQNRFRMARTAALRWHELGDELITGLLAPWSAALLEALEPLVGDVIEGRHKGMADANIFAFENQITDDDITAYAHQLDRLQPMYRRLRAQQLVRQWRQLVETVVDGELRPRGLVEDLHPDSGIARSALVFADPAVLPDISYAVTRETLWTAEAIANGARARLATAAEAAKTGLKGFTTDAQIDALPTEPFVYSP